MKDIIIGCNVKLTNSMYLHCADPEKYATGVVTKIGYYGIVYVKWNGIGHPVGMRDDEITNA